MQLNQKFSCEMNKWFSIRLLVDYIAHRTYFIWYAYRTHSDGGINSQTKKEWIRKKLIQNNLIKQKTNNKFLLPVLICMEMGCEHSISRNLHKNKIFCIFYVLSLFLSVSLSFPRDQLYFFIGRMFFFFFISIQ